MGVAHDVINKVGQALGGVRAGAAKLISRRLSGDRVIVVSSPAFIDGEPLPLSTTRDGDGEPPEIVWESLPESTKSIVVVVEDPDAPRPEPFVHWLVYGIPPTARALDASMVLAARQGKNSALRRGYFPPSPPPGHGVHHYHFQVIALDFPIAYADDVGRRELLAAMNGHVVGWGELVGTYERK